MIAAMNDRRLPMTTGLGAGVFKRKTREAVGDLQSMIDGCAIFFKTERYSLLEQVPPYKAD